MATTAFLLILGVATLPTTISYGGNAWWSALLPLACVVFLAWILLKIQRAKIGLTSAERLAYYCSQLYWELLRNTFGWVP
ncbi:MAG TPA: hypothetical protein VKK79_06420 [Candidatus Lokiarchaeia archaeon]|nr:hypothetical protein [Candidatus Lokiarchaeia archaeon]